MPPSREAPSRGSFVDSARIHVQAGHGGGGAVPFRREPYVPRGGPDGGDGGRGGSVVLVATSGESSLAPYARRRQWRAEDGRPGAGGLKSGRGGAEVRLPVPVGTAVYEDSSGALLADLDAPGAEFVRAAGGAGGRGNVHFKSSVKRAPQIAEPGLPRAELGVRLELRLIGGGGLIAPPNAGKSSLLRDVSAATPRVADYPFTTLDPQLGVAELPGDRRMVVADIPGLIEGAARGAGLGLRFLRHVERTRVLVYMVDGSRPDPWADLAAIRKEVEAYSPELAKRPFVVAINKLDLEPTRRLKSRNRRKNIHFVSALSGEGLAELMKAMVPALAAAPEVSAQGRAKTIKLPEHTAVAALTVEKKPWGFAVSGDRIEQL